MAEWDLVPTLAKYLDPQFVFGLIQFISTKDIYDAGDLFKFEVDFLQKAGLVKPCAQLFDLNGLEVPQELQDKVLALEENKQRIASDLNEVVEIFSAKLEEHGSLAAALASNKFQLSKEKIDMLYAYSRLAYNSQSYKESAVFLNWYQHFIAPQDKNYLNVLWGELACSILSEEWDQALEQFNFLKGFIDGYNFSPIQALQQRTWLIHWGLFIFFNVKHGLGLLVDLFFDSKNLNSKQAQNNPFLIAIQTSCPHILRYLAAAVITHKQRRHYMKELVRLIEQESYNYRDPITEFVKCLYVNFNFDGAQQKLRDCEVVVRTDFFLTACIQDFIENARLFIFEIFCQIHECISIEMIADKLNMSIEEAERWVVKLIRDAHFDAKIDSKNGYFIMGTQAVSQYHSLIEKTKAIRMKTENLANNIEKLINRKADQRGIWN